MTQVEPDMLAWEAYLVERSYGGCTDLHTVRSCDCCLHCLAWQVGLGEGVAPSAATTVLARLMPANERSRAVSMVCDLPYCS